MHPSMHIHTYAHIYIHTYAHIYTHIHTVIHTVAHIQTCTHMHKIFTNTNIHKTRQEMEVELPSPDLVESTGRVKPMT